MDRLAYLQEQTQKLLESLRRMGLKSAPRRHDVPLHNAQPWVRTVSRDFIPTVEALLRDIGGTEPLETIEKRYEGVISALRQATDRAKSAYRVQQFHFREGDRVIYQEREGTVFGYTRDSKVKIRFPDGSWRAANARFVRKPDEAEPPAKD